MCLILPGFVVAINGPVGNLCLGVLKYSITGILWRWRGCVSRVVINLGPADFQNSCLNTEMFPPFLGTSTSTRGSWFTMISPYEMWKPCYVEIWISKTFRRSQVLIAWLLTCWTYPLATQIKWTYVDINFRGGWLKLLQMTPSATGVQPWAETLTMFQIKGL